MMKCNVKLWDDGKKWLWKCELKRGHKSNHKSTFNWIEIKSSETRRLFSS